MKNVLNKTFIIFYVYNYVFRFFKNLIFNIYYMDEEILAEANVGDEAVQVLKSFLTES